MYRTIPGQNCEIYSGLSSAKQGLIRLVSAFLISGTSLTQKGSKTMQKFIPIFSAAIFVSGLAMQARGDLVVTQPLITQAYAQADGAASYDNNTNTEIGSLYQNQSESGAGGASVGFSFDSGAGLTGSVSASQSAAELHGPQNLWFSAAGNSSASASNSSPDGYSEAYGVSFSNMAFSVGEIKSFA